MSKLQSWQTATGALICAVALAACGGGSGGGGGGGSTTSTEPGQASDSAQSLKIASDGLNQINARRTQAGMPALERSALVDTAARGHSDYQRLNKEVTHEQTVGKRGFTGVKLYDRLEKAGYTVPNASWAYGEVISAIATLDGAVLADELITAIYHRFAIFDPSYKQIGAGAATGASNYTYFTTNFAANGSYGPGIGTGNLAIWPADGQAGVSRNFFSDSETPDPVNDESLGEKINEVGYPVSVHADVNSIVRVTSFTIRPRGGADLRVKLLIREPAGKAVDVNTPISAASIIPLAPLAANTIYDVSFSGTVSGLPRTKTWSFTTKS